MDSNNNSSEKYIKKTQPKWLSNYSDLFNRVNSFCLSVLANITVDISNGQNVLWACLYARLIETSQAAVLLAEKGYRSSALSLLRVAVEAFILLKNTIDRDNFYEEFIKSFPLEMRKLLGVDNLKCVQNDFTTEEIATLEKQREYVKQLLDDWNPTGLNVKKMAERVGLEPTYNVVYRLTCGHTHHSPGSLTQYFVADEDLIIEGFIIGPDFEDSGLCILSLVEYLLQATSWINEIEKIKNPKGLNELFSETHHLANSKLVPNESELERMEF